MGFTGAHMLYVLDVFILALYLLSHVCALLEYTFQQKSGDNMCAVSKKDNLAIW